MNAIDISVSSNGLLPTDRIVWSGPPEITFDNNNGPAASFRTDVVGKYKIYYTIDGQDGFTNSGSTTICVGMSNSQMRDKLAPLLKYGLLPRNASGDFLSNANNAKADIIRHLTKSDIILIDELGLEMNPFDTFMSADLMGSRGKIVDIQIQNIYYDTTSCKISKIKLSTTRR